jgi:hypothetical protein
MGDVIEDPVFYLDDLWKTTLDIKPKRGYTMLFSRPIFLTQRPNRAMYMGGGNHDDGL